ncbi:uncharacterized protein [Antedon mediterranea]|uniref:uncharacterized protein n=1 Tax=Antedon mediterranea TaxID=105859 RepID=UPI003AF802C6
MEYKRMVTVCVVLVLCVCVSSERADNKTPEDKTLHKEGMSIVQKVYRILETITNMERNQEREAERKKEQDRYTPKRKGGEFKTQGWRKKRSTFGHNLMDITFIQQLDSDVNELKLDVKDFLEDLGKFRELFFHWMRTSSNKSQIKFENSDSYEFDGDEDIFTG